MSNLVGTVPSISMPAVAAFCSHFHLTAPPIYLPYTALGYAPDQCHISAKHHAMQNGGRRVHGWALWDFSGVLMGEFHSVWEDASGSLVDVTPPKFGASQVLFVRDPVTDIYILNGAIVFPADRMPPPYPQYSFQGSAIAQPIWGAPVTAPAIVTYCAQLGMAVADIETKPPFG